MSDFADVQISDDELTALALAADLDAPLPDDAVPLANYLLDYPQLLPQWYMPPPGGFTRTRTRRVVVVLVIIGLAVVNACGLCVTSGRLEIPF